MKTINVASEINQNKSLKVTKTILNTFKKTPLATELSGNITSNTFLEAGLYQITESNLTIACDVTLYIEPGTTFQFAKDKKMIVNGHINICESNTKPVVFTGINKCIWGGIEIYSDFWEPQSTAIMQHVIIEYAKKAISVGPRSSVLIDCNSILQKNKELNDYILGHLIIQNSKITSNHSGWHVQSIGKNPEDPNRVGHLELNGNVISKREITVLTEGFGKATLKDNTILKNAG